MPASSQTESLITICRSTSTQEVFYEKTENVISPKRAENRHSSDLTKLLHDRFQKVQATHEAERSQLQKEIDQFQSKIANLTADHENEHGRLRDTIEKLELELEDCSIAPASEKDLETDIPLLRSEKAAMERDIARLGTQRAENEQKIASLRTEIIDLETEAGQWSSQKAAFNQEIASLTTDKDAMHARVGALTTVVHDLSAQCGDLKAEKSRLEEEIECAAESIRLSVNEISATEEKMAELQATHKQLESGIVKMREEKEDYANKISELEAAFQTMADKSSDSQNEIEKLKLRKVLLKREVDEMETNAASLKRTHCEETEIRVRKLDELKKSLEAVSGELEAKRDILKKLNDEISFLKSESTAMVELLAQQHTEVDVSIEKTFHSDEFQTPQKQSTKSTLNTSCNDAKNTPGQISGITTGSTNLSDNICGLEVCLYQTTLHDRPPTSPPLWLRFSHSSVASPPTSAVASRSCRHWARRRVRSLWPPHMRRQTGSPAS
eukprot:938585_1